mmetsp:Transcript_39855/g.100107  ORF Transcript_39855/g.100107 Transcript_39855/m.100107 type:complete len:134 (-) Transcript_39855:25-426(-)
MTPEAEDPNLVVQPRGASTQDLPSLGSKLHSKRRCRPCAFVRSDAGCQDGAACRFCHMPHANSEKMQIRPCKGKRDRYKKFVDKLMRDISSNPDSVDLAELTLPQFIETNPARRGRVLARLSHHAAQARRMPV